MQKTTQTTYATRQYKTALIIAMLLFILQPVMAQAQDAEERLFWKSVICDQGEEVALYLELYPNSAYENKAHDCLRAIAATAAKDSAAQAAQKLARQWGQWVGEMVAIPAGRFRMGDMSGDGHTDEKPVHTVRISPFEMGAHEVTVGQFRAFVADSGYAGNCWTYGERTLARILAFRPHGSWRSPGFTQGDRHPVVCVSHDDAQAFIDWLNKKPGGHYRLPTEAEWEYAARAGTTSKFSWGNSESQADAYAWHNGNSGVRTHAVSGKKPNPWGLYDMHGNVYEWVADWYGAGYYASSPATDPQGPGSGVSRTVRGGAWGMATRRLRSAYRSVRPPSYRVSYLGFRLVRQPWYSFTLLPFAEPNLLCRACVSRHARQIF